VKATKNSGWYCCNSPSFLLPYHYRPWHSSAGNQDDFTPLSNVIQAIYLKTLSFSSRHWTDSDQLFVWLWLCAKPGIRLLFSLCSRFCRVPTFVIGWQGKHHTPYFHSYRSFLSLQKTKFITNLKKNDIAWMAELWWLGWNLDSIGNNNFQITDMSIPLFIFDVLHCCCTRLPDITSDEIAWKDAFVRQIK